MKSSLQAGVSLHRHAWHRPRATIDFMGEKARVYATPMLVRDIEVACRDLLLQHLDAGEDSVGTRVELDHTGATLMGMMVELQVAITEVAGPQHHLRRDWQRRHRRHLQVPHQRFVVDVAKTEQRLAAKALKAGLA
jgi:fluoroacetyl-CoA thioesterase